MIQRIQSIYLLLVAILMGVATFVPLIILKALDNLDGMPYIFTSLGIGQPTLLEYPTWGVCSFTLLATILAFINIFLYKKRKLQIKLSSCIAIIILLFYVTVYVYFSSYTAKYNLSFTSLQYGLVLPLIALIFNILAIIKIKKDEKLVRSLDRIR